MTVLLLSRDLVILSLVDGAAQRAGAGVDFAGDGTLAVAVCCKRPIDLVLVDLSTPSFDVKTLVATLRACDSPPKRIAAFGPHVHEAKLHAAREAGCNEVFTRGQLQERVEKLLEADL